ncbi:MAG: cytochrome c1 [Gammaproteobacteria bacterium]
MKNLIGIILLLTCFGALASATLELESVEIDLNDKASLKRGAQLYVTYCQGCHAVKHMRYSRIAEDLALSEDEVGRELIVGPKTINASMTSAIEEKSARDWFLGAGPPDLSVVARSRGVDWLYGYLRGFYLDETRPFGVNNLVYKDVAMPNVLWELQGFQQAVFEDMDGRPVFQRFESVQKGRMTAEQFDQAMRDLVNFLAYVGEPAKLERMRIGKYVILFLIGFLVLAYQLKKEYWKDVH